MTSRDNAGLLIVCHGSPLSEANEGFIALIDDHGKAQRWKMSCRPFLPFCGRTSGTRFRTGSRASTAIAIMPYFLFQGQHVGVDIPRILTQCHEWFPGVRLELLPTLENDPAMETVVVERLLPMVGEMDSPQ